MLPGTARPPPRTKDKDGKRKKLHPVLWGITKSAEIEADRFTPATPFNICASVVAQTGDVAKVGSHVLVRKSKDAEYARIIEILNPVSGSAVGSVVVAVRWFVLGKERHERLDVPSLTLTASQAVVPAQASQITYNPIRSHGVCNK